MKKDWREMGKIWKTLKTAFKWLFILILIFLLISFIKDFLDHYHFLVEKVSQQSNYIDSLQHTVHNLNETNTNLVNQLHIEHSKLENLQQQLSVKINGEPVHMSVEDVKRKIEPQLKLPSMSESFIPVTILTTMTLLKTLVFRFAF
jgi:hypothetical protein